MADKKPAKPSKPAAPEKAEPKAKTAAPEKAAAKPAEEAAKKPAKPAPAHQQFLSQGANKGGAKNQHMAKGRIFRHQGR